jgi:prevent-host-death family protein
MLIASVSEAKNKLSALLDRVKAGETILIVDRGRPVARLAPAPGADEDRNGRLSRLERAGIVRVGEGSIPGRVLSTRPPRPRTKGAALEALLAERRTGR